MKLVKLTVNPEDIARQHGEKRNDKVTAAREFSRKECRPKSKSMSDLLLSCFVIAMLVCAGAAQADDGSAAAARSPSMGEVSAKLSNPLSDLWALQFENDFNWFDGDIVGGYQYGSVTIFQPVMPFNLSENWKLITRPIVPLVTRSPIAGDLKPDGNASFGYKSGLGDITVPILFSPKKKIGGHLMWGAGPTFVFPTGSHKGLTTNTWEAGPALVGVYQTKKITIGALGQYWWSYATQKSDNTSHTSHGSIFYFAFYNLPHAWQIGTNPSITYNDTATPGNKWNVPIGLTIGKTIKIGKTPVKFQLGVSKSIVRQDAFGQDWQIKLNITPVIPALVTRQIF